MSESRSPDWSELLEAMTSPGESPGKTAAWLQIRRLVRNCARPYRVRLGEEVDDLVHACLVDLPRRYTTGTIRQPSRLPGFIKRDVRVRVSQKSRDEARFEGGARAQQVIEGLQAPHEDDPLRGVLRSRVSAELLTLDERAQLLLTITLVEGRSRRDAFETYRERLAAHGIRTINQFTYRARLALRSLLDAVGGRDGADQSSKLIPADPVAPINIPDASLREPARDETFQIVGAGPLSG